MRSNSSIGRKNLGGETQIVSSTLSGYTRVQMNLPGLLSYNPLLPKETILGEATGDAVITFVESELSVIPMVCVFLERDIALHHDLYHVVRYYPIILSSFLYRSTMFASRRLRNRTCNMHHHLFGGNGRVRKIKDDAGISRLAPAQHPPTEVIFDFRRK